VHFLVVSTPQNKQDSSADMSYIDAAIDALCPHLDRPTLIVGKSTVPVGTAQRLAERARRIAPAGDGVELAWNRSSSGRASAAGHPAPGPHRGRCRGPAGLRSERLLRALYAPLLDCGTPFLVTTLETAELVKVAANAFLATKISFINAIAEVCDVTSANIATWPMRSVTTAGSGAVLDAGLGFGGGCLSKDIRGFVTRATELGVGDSLNFLREIDDLNCRRRATSWTSPGMRGIAGRRTGGRPGCGVQGPTPTTSVTARWTSRPDPVGRSGGKRVRPEGYGQCAKASPPSTMRSPPSEACTGVDAV
jgi:UDPglucose 6-dehydrogenase